ncbi:hypothetical protein JCM10908_005909 [Rhodotorula pacifica]|uniref:uncharacterized protein n=1 Tax=Rhodotorula pacifica TaxID=1495444 RepID=UPI0031702A84
MSSSGSVTISYTTLAEVALVAALVGGIAYIGSSKSANSPHPTTSSLAPTSSAGAKKSSKKKKGSSKASPAAVAVPEPVVEAATAVKDHVVAGASAAVKRVQPAVQEAVAQAKEAVAQVQQAVVEPAALGKKASKKGKKAPSPSPKPDATKHAEQKVQKEDAATADMIDAKDHPQVARVLKVVGGKVGAQPDEQWESFGGADQEDQDGGWESVVSKKPSRPSTPSLSANASSSSSPVVPGLPAAQMTKKQRENAAKKAKEQSAKELANQEQEERLRQYRREQERAKLAADNAARSRARPKSQNYFGSEPAAPASSKVLSGGMTASLDPTTGNLVWE